MLTLGKQILFLLLGFSLTLALQAQDAGTLPNLTPPPDAYQIERITALDGLPSSSIVGIEQDEEGYLWFAGQQGLFRYDGYTFSTFQNNPDDSTSLAANWVETLHVDPQGTLWAGTYEGGLNRFNPKTETFTAFRHVPGDPTSLSQDTITVLLTDRQGTLWVGTHNGLNRFDPESETFIRFQHDSEDSNSLSNNQVRVLYEDRQGTLWVGTGSPTLTETPRGEGGLNRFHPETGTFTRYLHDPDDPNSLLRNKITALYEDTDGTFWVGTLAQGLHTMDREQGTFTRLRMDPQNPNQLNLPYRNADFVDATSCLTWECGLVSFIHEDRDGTFWIGDYGAGIVRYDRATGTMEPYEPEPTNPNSLSSEDVWDMQEIRDGSLWVSTWQGVSKITSRRGHFRTLTGLANAFIDGPGNYMHSFYTSPREPGIYWMGTSYGILVRYDATRQTMERFDLDPGTPRRYPVRAIVEDQEGYLWIGAGEREEGGLYRFDRATGTVESYVHDPMDETSLSHGAVRSLLVDRASTLWIGHGLHGGLNRFNPATKTFSRFATRTLSPTGENTDVLYEDGEGVFWVGNGLDVLRFDRQEERFTRDVYTFEVSDMVEDQAGRLWIASAINGLWLLDRADTTATRVEGLPESSIEWVEPDDRGYVWVAMQNTLARYDPEGGGLRTYGFADGLPTGTLARAHTWTDQGELLFGYESGTVMAFDPRLFEINDTPPQVQITTLQALDEPIALNNRSITLPHDQNDLTFEYVGLHFSDPSQNQYRYLLEDYDRSWVEAGTQRSVRYPRLPPGNYTFRVTAANNDGIWNEEGASVRVAVLPPWWRTWWAYALYGLLFMGGVFAVDRVQRKRVLRKERERTQARELEQAREIEKAYHDLRDTKDRLVQQEKMASLGQLTAGIAHEIKNPLNFINNFAEVNEELADELRQAYDANPDIKLAELLDVLDDLKQNAQVINQHGKRADGIVHAMMQHASGGTGQHQPTDVNALVSEHVNLAYHGKRAQVPDLHVTVKRDLDAQAGTVDMVPQEIGRVLLNLLGNAFDAVHEHAVSLDGAYTPTVTVSTRQVEDQLEIRVSDNGPGIPSEIRDRIFEPFFTTKPTGTGTGLGLSLSYDIVTQGHGGMLSVESTEGEGASFIITLPG